MACSRVRRVRFVGMLVSLCGGLEAVPDQSSFRPRSRAVFGSTSSSRWITSVKAATVLPLVSDTPPMSFRRRRKSGSATIRATSRAQLDALYLELTAHPMVKVVL